MCGKKSLLLLYSCVFAFFAAAVALDLGLSFFLFSSGDGCSAYFFVERLHTRSVLALLVFFERIFVVLWFLLS